MTIFGHKAPPTALLGPLHHPAQHRGGDRRPGTSRPTARRRWWAAAGIRPPAAAWFGTDQIGRDMLTRLIYGARMTIGIALRHHAAVLRDRHHARAGGGRDGALGRHSDLAGRRRGAVDPAADLGADDPQRARPVAVLAGADHRLPRLDPRVPPRPCARARARLPRLRGGGADARRGPVVGGEPRDPAQRRRAR